MRHLTAIIVLSALLTGCGEEEFTKDHSGSFLANGVSYVAEADNVTASYVNDSILSITIGAGPSMTNTATLRVNLNKPLNITVPILFIDNEGYDYYGSNSAVAYEARVGSYEIKSHEEGNPATRHTEGIFHYTAVNMATLDTIFITEGKFYVNNY
jgi:hypothetical protein